MGIRDHHKQQTYNKILNAIHELVQEKDYDSITIREIAQKAGISVGSYYKYFQSKDDIIFQQMRKSFMFTQEDIAPQLNKTSGIENLKVYLEMQNELVTGSNIPWLREVFRLFLYHRLEVVLDQQSVNYKVIEKIVIQGQKDGTLRNDIASTELAWIILKMIIANYYSYCMQNGNFDLNQVMCQEIFDLVQARK